jgi:hypothetical protein
MSDVTEQPNEVIIPTQQLRNDMWLNRIKIQLNADDNKKMVSLRLSCFLFVFKRTLTPEEQNKILAFMKNGKHMESLDLPDYFEFFDKNNIPFVLKFKHNKKYPIGYNRSCRKRVKQLRKQRKEMK